MDTQTIEQIVDLTGRAAVVMNGATDVGREAALRLVDAGAAVVVSDTNLGELEGLVEGIQARGGKIAAEEASAVDGGKAAETAVNRFGGLDILINATCLFSPDPVPGGSEEAWNQALNENLRGAAMRCKAAASKMIETGRGGRIVNIALADVLQPFFTLERYAIAANKLARLSKLLAEEYGSQGITVNAVVPSIALTQDQQMQTESALKALPVSGRKLPKERAPRPFAVRMGAPEDVATVVLYLVSRAGQGVTGNLIEVT